MVGVGTRCPVIGAGGGADGSPRIARLAVIMVDGGTMADGVRTALGKAPTEIGVLMPIGEAPKASIVLVELTLQRFGSIPYADDSSPLS